MKQRATKIVATLGPASSSPEVLERMIRAGVDVVRVNFSHGTAAAHTETVAMVRKIADQCGRGVGVLADLQGPKIRIGKFAEGKITLDPGMPFVEQQLADPALVEFTRDHAEPEPVEDRKGQQGSEVGGNVLHAVEVLSKWERRRSRARFPAARSQQFTMATRKPPGGMAWRAGSRS